MAKRSIVSSDSFIEVVDEEETPTYVRVTLLKSVILKAIGKVTGNVYIFSGAGSEVDVDERDLEGLIDRRAVSCCSGNTASPYFEVKR